MSNSPSECSLPADEQAEDAVWHMTKYVDLFKTILDTNNPKEELNHIYFDEENMVATDARMMVVYKHGMDIDVPFMAVNPRVKVSKAKKPKIEAIDYSLSKWTNIGTIRMLKDEWNKVIPPEGTRGYPDYKRIMPKYSSEGLAKVSGLDALYKRGYYHGIMFNYIEYCQFMKKLDKIEFTKVYFENKDLPIMLENDDLKVIMMPVVY